MKRNGKRGRRMSIDDIIYQLESLKDNSRSFIEEDEPDSVWVQDVAALDEAIKIIKDKSGRGDEK